MERGLTTILEGRRSSEEKQTEREELFSLVGSLIQPYKRIAN
jgi:hypothetical protein